MKKFSIALLTATAVLLSSIPFFATANNARVVEACLVTEVLDWGETLTAIRIEYSEEIDAQAIDFRTFVTSSTRNILYPYVNNSGKLDDAKLAEIVEREFDLRPASIIRYLDLRRPIYRQTAAYGHFGRPDLDLPWEKTDVAERLAAYL